MEKNSSIRRQDLSDILYKGFLIARQKLIEEEKKKNGYLVLLRNGVIVKVPAKDL